MCGSKIEQSDTEIEVTPEMIDAGVAIFVGEYPDSGAGDVADRKMVRDIFRAMLTAP